MMNSPISRRQVLKKAAAVTFAAPGLLQCSKDGGPQKPNLLFFLTDEQRYDTMAAYGNTSIHTPNLNILAKDCMVFEKAYVTQPVCAPARSSIMTGLWPHQNH